MGRLSRSYTPEDLEKALRKIDEEPKWNRLPNTQMQHKSIRFKAVVNIWTTRGTVLVQGGGAAPFERALREALGEGGMDSIASTSSSAPATAAASAQGQVPDARWHLYVDGSCPANALVREQTVSAGWGVAIYEKNAGNGMTPVAELYGPVVTAASSPLSLGAEISSNNTGELSALGEAFLWLRDEAPGSRDAGAVLHYDSEYAANIVLRRNKAHKNVALAERLQQLWDEVRQQRSLELMHVKGHSGCAGNELADRLAAKGAEGLFSLSSKRWEAAGEAAGEAAAIASAAAVLACSTPRNSRRRPPTPATGDIDRPLKRLRPDDMSTITVDDAK